METYGGVGWLRKDGRTEFPEVQKSFENLLLEENNRQYLVAAGKKNRRTPRSKVSGSAIRYRN